MTGMQQPRERSGRRGDRKHLQYGSAGCRRACRFSFLLQKRIVIPQRSEASEGISKY